MFCAEGNLREGGRESRGVFDHGGSRSKIGGDKRILNHIVNSEVLEATRLTLGVPSADGSNEQHLEPSADVKTRYPPPREAGQWLRGGIQTAAGSA